MNQGSTLITVQGRKESKFWGAGFGVFLFEIKVISRRLWTSVLEYFLETPQNPKPF